MELGGKTKYKSPWTMKQDRPQETNLKKGEDGRTEGKERRNFAVSFVNHDPKLKCW